MAFIIERIVGTGICPTFDEIGYRLGVSDTRARQLVDELVRRGDVERTPGEVRGLRVRDIAGARRLLQRSAVAPGGADDATAGEARHRCAPPSLPFADEKIPLLPPFEHLPDLD